METSRNGFAALQTPGNMPDNTFGHKDPAGTSSETLDARLAADALAFASLLAREPGTPEPVEAVASVPDDDVGAAPMAADALPRSPDAESHAVGRAPTAPTERNAPSTGDGFGEPVATGALAATTSTENLAMPVFATALTAPELPVVAAAPARHPLTPAHRTPDPEAATLARLRDHITHLFVDDAAGGERVTASLHDTVLPGVTLSVATQDGYLCARFDCVHAMQWHRLSDLRFEIAERIADVMDAGIQVRVVHLNEPSSYRDARAGDSR
ncbi:hypothetical protein FP568_04420 [Pandoraea pnomenusa]|uniref:hypothetical protein n=1 Tax=Pandoraea pnomenusa TaxID=93220 RepID=UPI00119886D6|nr:hypothetical protein [Pandoraea pnomenusa]QDX20573.1 hypothetical protein FP568_04420 [Pandoraea pnomenusa]